MRRFLKVFFVVIALASAAGREGLAAGKERLVMPFDCSVSGGRLSVRPSATAAYEIAGSRSDQPVTACQRDSDVCTTLMVHRFEILCGTTRVPWIHVAMAAAANLPGRRWVDKGRMGLIRPARTGTATERWFFPAGYAPLTEASARIEAAPITGSAPAAVPAPGRARPVAPVEQAAAPVPSTPSSPAQAANAAAIPASPPAPAPPVPVAAPAKIAGVAPVKVIEAVDLSDVRHQETLEAPPVNAAYLWLAGLAALGLVGFFARRFDREQIGERLTRAGNQSNRLASSLMDRLARVTESNAGEVPLTHEGEDPALAHAAWQAATLLDQIEQAVAGLDTATPLRDVLQDELRLIHQRLVTTRAAALDGGSAAKAANQYRALIRELERVRRIADSAASSFANVRPDTAPPQTKSEAYALLGVNADVSEGILKKLVDALRMTWHPDHARSEQDRLVREDRIKLINIAWDIISDKRHAA